MIRILFISFCCCLSSLNSIAQTATPKIIASVKNGQITIGKAVVTKNWSAAALLQVLDKKNDRRRAGFNTTHTFDRLGIVVFEKNDMQKLPTDTVSEIQFYFNFKAGDSNAVAAKEVFTGVLKIETLKITGNETPDLMKEKLKDYKVTDSYMEHNFRLSNKGLYIYFQFNDEEDKLMKISIGKDSRKY